MVQVFTIVTAQPKSVEIGRAVSAGIFEPTRKRPGCLSDHLLRNRSNLSAVARMVVAASPAAQQAHRQAAHMQNAGMIAGAFGRRVGHPSRWDDDLRGSKNRTDEMGGEPRRLAPPIGPYAAFIGTCCRMNFVMGSMSDSE